MMSRARSCSESSVFCIGTRAYEQVAIAGGRGDHEAGQYRRDHGEPHRGTERFCLPGGRDHFRRRRLTGRQGRGQRIAAGQRRRDRERRGRPLVGLRLQASLDHRLDLWVERLDDRRRRNDA